MEELNTQYGHNKPFQQIQEHGKLTTTTTIGRYKNRDELKPHCEECVQEVTVEHLIWQCVAYNSQRRRNSITKDIMGDNKE
jgi:hypothetical protein